MRKLFLSIFVVCCGLQLFGQTGLKFNSLDGPPGGNVSRIVRASTGKLFAISNDSLYQSTNNGSNWSSANLDNANNGLIDVYVDGADKIYVVSKTRLFKSTDLGVTWTQTTPTGTFNPRGKFLKNEATQTLFVIASGVNPQPASILQRSVDDGQTWTDSFESEQVNDFTILGGVILLGGNNTGMHRSSQVEDGTGWTAFNTGIVGGGGPISMTTNTNLGRAYVIVNGAEGIYSTTGAGSWVKAVGAGAPITFGLGGGNQYKVYSSSNTSRVFVSLNNNLFYSDNTNVITPTWTQFTLNNTDDPIEVFAFSSTIWVGLNNNFRHADGLLRSTNSGTAWSYSDNGIANYQTSSMVLANDNQRLTAVNGGGTIVTSNDGLSWTKTKLCDCSFQTLIKRSNGNIVAIGDRTYLSTDNGQNWNPLGSPHADFLNRLVSGDGGTTVFGIAGIGSKKIYKSVNGGQSFSELTITGISGTPGLNALAADAAGNLYAWTEDQKIYKLAAPSNTSATQITNSGISSFRGVHAVGNNVYIVGEKPSNGSALAKSTNQGSSWTLQNIDDASQIVMVNDQLIFAVTFDNEIAFSNDGGVNWDIAFATNQSGLNLAHAVIDEFGIAYVSTVKGPLRKSNMSVVKPNQPTNLKTIGFSDNVVYLEWDYNSSGGAFAETFIVERRPTAGGTFEVVGEADGSERYFRNEGTVKNTSYDYRVIADSDAILTTDLSSTTSAPITVVTKDDCPLTIPDNRSWSGSVDGGAFTTASPVVIKKVSSDYYSISEFTAGSLNGVPRIGGGTYSSTSVSTFFNEACGTPFTEIKNDVLPNGNGTWNGTNTLTLKFQLDKAQYNDTEKIITLTLNVSDPTPAVPTGLSAYVLTGTQIQVQWQVGDFQQSYVVERSTTSGSGFSQVGIVNYPTLLLNDSGPFTAGTTYFYRVKARNSTLVESAYTGEVSVVFNTPNFVLSNTVVSSTAASAPTLAWGDFNNDGFEDLIMSKLNFVSPGLEEPLLFRNAGGTDFQIVTGQLPTAANLAAPSVADYNNDGNLDVFVSGFGLDGGGPQTGKFGGEYDTSVGQRRLWP